jgi:hypothetical protein
LAKLQNRPLAAVYLKTTPQKQQTSPQNIQIKHPASKRAVAQHFLGLLEPFFGRFVFPKGYSPGRTRILPTPIGPILTKWQKPYLAFWKN